MNIEPLTITRLIVAIGAVWAASTVLVFIATRQIRAALDTARGHAEDLQARKEALDAATRARVDELQARIDQLRGHVEQLQARNEALAFEVDVARPGSPLVAWVTRYGPATTHQFVEAFGPGVAAKLVDLHDAGELVSDGDMWARPEPDEVHRWPVEVPQPWDTIQPSAQLAQQIRDRYGPGRRYPPPPRGLGPRRTLSPVS